MNAGGADTALPFSSGSTIEDCDTLFYANSSYANGTNKYTFTSNYKGILYSPSRTLSSYNHYINNTKLTGDNVITLASGSPLAQNQTTCYLYLYIGQISAGDTFYSNENRIATLWGIK